MSFEDAVNGAAATMARAAVAGSAADDAVRSTFESVRCVAARRMGRALAHASNRLLKRSVPTSLAAVTAGPDGVAWHFVAQALGWPLENVDAATAFLTVDGRICFYRKARTFGGDEFLAVDRVLSTFEGGSATTKLVNPEGLVPGSGRVISLPAREPVWMTAPQRLVEFNDNRAIARWPRTGLHNPVSVDFDRDGKVWITHLDWDSHMRVLLKEWLAMTAAQLLTRD